MFFRLLPAAVLLTTLLAGPARAQTAASAVPTLTAAAPSSPLKTYALRLRPGQDLKQELTAFVAKNQLKAGAVLTCVGSLTHVVLRLANQDNAATYHGHFEIVSLVGTLSTAGSHLHLAVADSTGRTIGGHLLDGCRIYTTAELVLAELPALEFRRETDPTFGYQELTVYPAAPKPRRPAAGSQTGPKR